MFSDEYAFGWTDLNMVRHAELVNELDSMMVTHLDVLNQVDTIKIAQRYTMEGGNGDKPQIFSKSLPTKIDDWPLMVPEYVEMPGWNKELDGVESFE